MAVYTVRAKQDTVITYTNSSAGKIAIGFVYGSRATCKSTQLKAPAHILNAFEEINRQVLSTHAYAPTMGSQMPPIFIASLKRQINIYQFKNEKLILNA